MLIRNNDRPIIDQSRGHLRWIVLDEAHTYLGSNAAEVSLLLRRVMDAFQADPSNVHFVATSATIGGEESKEDSLLSSLPAIRSPDTKPVVVDFPHYQGPIWDVDNPTVRLGACSHTPGVY